eukprot:CAMPEP_0194391880 /NCGR_PEP_ID=MMETSP0174-20130528/118333_1 /TAXON_ID=216777 /ORGANISM="Proboscia alata, Strain PI-D3" /LENGTH=81 /DNA_ID=CAMNT_0039186683 /DNA_START=205 /DNA_END=446 /DNA_ORIENTATION=-
MLEAVKDIIGISDKHGIAKFNLAGHSFGCQLGLTLVRSNPNRVNRALLHATEGYDHNLDDVDEAKAVIETIGRHADEQGFT